LLATPFREVEVVYAIGTDWLDWKYARDWRGPTLAMAPTFR